jgi:protein SCO1/2
MSQATKKSPAWKIAGILFLLIGMPILWIMLNKTGVHYSKKLPYLFEKEVNENGDSIAPVVDNFKLLNQYGDSVTLETYKGKLLLVNFFFASCETACPRMNNFIAQNIYREFEKDDQVVFLSFSVDPYNDSPAVLMNYAKKLNASAHWQFLTGSKTKIYDLAEHSFRIPGAEDEHQGLFHSSKIALVDKEGHVRGVFDTYTQEDKSSAIDAVRALKLEYKK